MPDPHRGRLELLYTDDGTCYKDKTTGLYLHVSKMYGYEAYDVKVQEHSARVLYQRNLPEPKVSGKKRFDHRPGRRELTEWLDEVVAEHQGS